MIAVPSLPDGSPEVPGGAQDLVASRRGRTVFFPKAPVLANGDDGGGASIQDGRMAAARVVGAITGHGADLFPWRYLAQQFGQDRTVALSLEVNSTARMSPVPVSIAR